MKEICGYYAIVFIHDFRYVMVNYNTYLKQNINIISLTKNEDVTVLR